MTMNLWADNAHRWWMDHSTAGLIFNKTGIDQSRIMFLLECSEAVQSKIVKLEMSHTYSDILPQWWMFSPVRLQIILKAKITEQWIGECWWWSSSQSGKPFNQFKAIPNQAESSKLGGIYKDTNNCLNYQYTSLFICQTSSRSLGRSSLFHWQHEREKERERGHFRESLWCKLDSAETLFEAECGTLVCAFLPACRYLQMAAIKWTQISTFCNDFASARDVTAFKSSKLALNAFQLR